MSTRDTAALARKGGFGVLAAALAKSGVVDPRVAKRAGTLTDVRTWLGRLAEGETVRVREMSDRLTSDERGEVAARLRLAGFLHTVVQGGARMGDSLRTVRLADVTDEQLAELIWGARRAADVVPTPRDELAARSAYVHEGPETDAPADPEPAPVHPAPAGLVRPPKPAWGPVPRTKGARDAAFLAHVRAWLGRIAAGEYVPISHLSNVLSGPACSQHGGRLCGAGLVDRSTGVYLATALTREAASEWADERLAAVLWPGKTEPAAEAAPEPTPEEVEAGTAAWAEAHNADLAAQLAATEPAPPPAPEDPLAGLLGRMLDVLVRLDARMGRFERELGLPAIEDDPKAKGGAL